MQLAIASLPDGARARVTCRNIERTVYADSTRLRQILRNLLENAVKYGGPDIVVDTAIAGRKVAVVVSDNGEALTDSDLSRIFEPYEQSSDERPEAPTGVGIGLYVSRLLAQLMDQDHLAQRADRRPARRPTDAHRYRSRSNLRPGSDRDRDRSGHLWQTQTDTA